jgi:NAD(P)-dependent dehydrogenase (short-subunit alcohol dehydrogenase family)
MLPAVKRGLTLGALSVAGYYAARAMIRQRRYIDLKDKTAIVTGGSRGLGLAIARELAAAGVKLALCARTEEDLQEAAAGLRQIGGPVTTHVVDVRDPAAVMQLVKEVEDRWEKVDLLFNVAGVMIVGPIDEMTLEDFQEVMQTNCFGPLHTMMATAPGMRKRRFGRIVNISSIGGKQAVPHMAPYDASKFALVGLSKAFRTELAQDNVLVTTACPTLMRTGSPRNAQFKGRHQQEYAWFSIGGALPWVSISADLAAQQVVAACQYGDAECYVANYFNPPVWAARFAPALTQELFEWINLLLPAPGGIGQAAARGYESHSGASPSWLTSLQDQAAKEYNQMRPRAPESA